MTTEPARESRTTALVVDDTESGRDLLDSLLSASGYRVVTACHGQDALELALASSPDLIISDILMPVMDGFTLCRKCKADAGLRHIPFIFYSASYNNDQDQLLATQAGADQFLTKPIDPEQFLEAIGKIDRERKAGQLQPAREPIPEDVEYLRRYNRVLVRQLEMKLEELSSLNRELEQRVMARTAQLKAANTELEAFAHSVSHDLRAPLRHVVGFLGLARDKAGPTLNPAAARHLDTAVTAARRMDQLISDLLSFSRTSRADFRATRVPLKALVDDVIRTVSIDTEGHTVEWKVHPLPEVRGDPSLLRQALVNLIGNALKFSRKRPVARIEIGSETSATEHTIFVRDNGVGFEMRHAGRLFGVFQRLHTTEQFEGSGVGLANVQRIIHRHDGRVWAESQLDQGATFFFTLPK